MSWLKRVRQIIGLLLFCLMSQAFSPLMPSQGLASDDTFEEGMSLSSPRHSSPVPSAPVPDEPSRQVSYLDLVEEADDALLVRGTPLIRLTAAPHPHTPVIHFHGITHVPLLFPPEIL